MARHALASEDKQARREVILEAARGLFITGDGSLPSAAQIAAASGLAKGTVYLYFRTKEEIFAALLLAGWGTLMDDVAVAIAGTRGRRGDKVNAFLTTYVGHLERHPELLGLDALGPGVLERNLGAVTLRDFKLTLVGQLTEVGAVVEKALRLTDGRGLRLLMRTYALTRGLWQSSQGYEDPALLETVPALAYLHPDFGTELREALTEYWRGALTDSHQQQPFEAAVPHSVGVRQTTRDRTVRLVR